MGSFTLLGSRITVVVIFIYVLILKFECFKKQLCFFYVLFVVLTESGKYSIVRYLKPGKLADLSSVLTKNDVSVDSEMLSWRDDGLCHIQHSVHHQHQPVDDGSLLHTPERIRHVLCKPASFDHKGVTR